MKKDILIRFAGDSTYYHRINIDPKKIKDEMIFRNEVFFTIDETRVAVKREDWDEIKNEINKKK
jgi:hypothetical protein